MAMSGTKTAMMMMLVLDSPPLLLSSSLSSPPLLPPFVVTEDDCTCMPAIEPESTNFSALCWAMAAGEAGALLVETSSVTVTEP